MCQHSAVNKKCSAHKTGFNTGCTAKLDIVIKKCTPATKRNDKYLKLKFNLKIFIKQFTADVYEYFNEHTILHTLDDICIFLSFTGYV